MVFRHLLFFKAQEEFDEDDDPEDREKKKIVRNPDYYDMLIVNEI